MAEEFSEPTDQSPTPKSPRNFIITFAGIATVVIALISFALVSGSASGGYQLPPDPVGKQVPDVTLSRLDGEGKLSLHTYIGKPMVINFWASWCTTCMEEAAVLAKAEKEWRSKGVVFIGINASDVNAAAQEFEDYYGIEYPSIVDRNGELAPRWGVNGYPQTFFVGRDGRIVSKFVSAIDESKLTAFLKEITT